MSTTAIQYVGDKTRKEDNVAATGTVWNGPGDVQLVPEAAAPKLLAHPTVWQPFTPPPVDHTPPASSIQPPPPVNPPGDNTDGPRFVVQVAAEDGSPVDVNLDPMSDNEVKRVIHQLRLNVDKRKRGDELKQLTVDAYRAAKGQE